MCNGSDHNLIEIYSRSAPGGYDEYDVVRWCTDCGAVVVDLDCDNRTYPGRVMKMKFPTGKREEKK